jgi:hypothetical protein
MERLCVQEILRKCFTRNNQFYKFESQSGKFFRSAIYDGLPIYIAPCSVVEVDRRFGDA